MIKTLVVEREIAHAPEKIWRALTQPALIAEWLMQNDFEPEVGRKFSLRATPMPQWNGVIDCEVLAIEPTSRLSYTWNSAGLDTVVTFTLIPSARGTLLRMEQSGFGPSDARNYHGAQYGWVRNLEKLEQAVAAS